MKQLIPFFRHKLKGRRTCLITAFAFASLLPLTSRSQSQATYYIDGFHGGIWGHYPDWNTRFMADMLHQHPYWKINLEIEPETWDRAEKVDSAAYRDFKNMVAGTGYTSRIEYVNPAYAQSYNYNIDGESIIRQFSYGIKKLKEHFPGIQFISYSSEEPCFTSALPQILTSFGIKYASLKNPNTCFGGYTRAHGGELVNWEGPDGTHILTVPRYEVEALEPKSTWQTIAWDNSPAYIQAAFAYGISHPVGMTLQDAGWKGGPFRGDGNAPRTQNQYVTWRDYFTLVKADAQPVWKVSQEDIQVSLVWGSQITQRIAQQVRAAENKLLGTEKLLAMTNLLSGKPWPQAAIDSAWRTLLLSQHHDCWIVPYNGPKGNTWADKVVRWSGNANRLSDSLINEALHPADVKNTASTVHIPVTVFNTQLQARTAPVMIDVPGGMAGPGLMVTDGAGHPQPVQLVTDSASNKKLLFNATVSGYGYNRFYLMPGRAGSVRGAHATRLSNGNYQLESNLYRLVINPKLGGSISSLYAKALHKEFVDAHSALKFNGMRGNFYRDGGFKTSYEAPASVKVMENGPVRVKLQINGSINGTAWTEYLTLTENEQVIDVNLNINWQHNVGIGEDTAPGTYKWTNYQKPFYDDRNKLLAVFPLNLAQQKVYKNAPFDVTESRLKNTFFNSWDSIKNNVILNWVDITDGQSRYGMALFSDHTTSYAHGEDFPLGLTLQYSGMGLWGRDYTITGPTHLHYALMPHSGRWDKAQVWSASAGWNEPLIAQAGSGESQPANALLASASNGLVLTTASTNGLTFTMRVFNAEGNSGTKLIKPEFKYAKAELIKLNGEAETGEIKTTASAAKSQEIELYVPKFGLRTIRFTGVRPLAGQ